MKYRAEIDGLRAIAVIPVIFFHAGFALFSGGFLGVDVFFVISGYLITTIIHDEIKTGTFSITNFYERRVRRIMPALFFVSLACIPFAWLWLAPVEYKDFSQSLVAVNLFLSNVLFWMESDYFAPAAELKPLLHTWSLAVEEQFYVFFPVLLILFRKLKDRPLLILLLGITLISLGVSEYSARNHPVANFYFLTSRAWELGLGCILAIGMPYISQIRFSFSQVLSVLGIVMIVWPMLAFDNTIPIPSSYGLIPVIGTCLVIAYARRGTLVGGILGWSPFVGIGLISYSAYLWHHPLFAFARIRLLGEPSTGLYIALSLISLGLAYLTWRFIETPFRNKEKYTRSRIFAAAAACSVVFISFGVAGHLNNGFEKYRYSDNERQILDFLKYVPKQAYRSGTCFLNPTQSYKDFQSECFAPGVEKDSYFVWGDSHAAALSFGIRSLRPDMTQLNSASCLPLTGFPLQGDRCSANNDFALAKVKLLKPKFVILHGNWYEHLDKAMTAEQLVEALSGTIVSIQHASPDSRVFVVGGVPQWYPSLPVVLIRTGTSVADEAFIGSTRYKVVWETDALLSRVAHQNQVGFLSILDICCRNEVCRSSVRSGDSYEPLVFDYGHLTRSASVDIAGKLIHQLENDQ